MHGKRDYQSFSIRALRLGVWGAAVCWVASGCLLSEDDEPASGMDSSGIDRGSETDTGGVDKGSEGTNAEVIEVLGFAPTIIPESAIRAPSRALEITGTCEIDGQSGTISCAQEDQFAYQSIEQSDPDRTSLGVFTFSDLTLAATAQVRLAGTFPTAFVVLGEARIVGILRAMPARFASGRGLAGGYSVPDMGYARGVGPGGGGGADSNGAGGGGHCGKGGGENGGMPYGDAEISVLRGGSSGGSGDLSSDGAGGGAIQIVAAERITIGTTGLINAGGEGGGSGGLSSQLAGGGGAGGAILLEAPEIVVAGILTANGGGGGGDWDGQLARDDNAPAQGISAGSFHGAGGSGSGGDTVDGAPGANLNDEGEVVATAGGGGGSGWIRLNTSSGAADVAEATISPSLDTKCASEGSL